MEPRSYRCAKMLLTDKADLVLNMIARVVLLVQVVIILLP